MNVRRSATALAAVGLMATAAAPATAASSPSPSPAPSGLYGTTDPKYDGVWRQSLALLAQHTVGVRPAAAAVGWLTGQQCASGGFAAFRPDPAKSCEATAAQADTNSTAAAVQALAALGGHDGAVRRAADWLKKAQNEDGGWGYAPGGPSDTNSTSVVVGALKAAGEDPGRPRGAGGGTPFALLAKWSVPCDKDGGGGLAYQPDKKGTLAANADATAAGVPAALGQGFVVAPGRTPEGAHGCAGSGKPLTPGEVARNGAAYLSAQVHGTGYLKSVLPGAKDQPDFGNTADTVVALAALGWTAEAREPYAWLEKNATPWAKQSGPAAYAELILAAHALGADPHAFGGTDLVAALDATGPAPAAHPAGAEKATKHTKGSGAGVWWIVGVGLVAGIGIGFLLSGRRGKRRP
ncbi:prenyltransferase/squalene oxidase repeat-containing protein [Streptomyces sp. NPDC006739]|uniref:prenyltransferase/squalene oxidase repeat-containing protein n=1 Tax=Streptomyces sp. NPDC006739 TaxID=3364763 RepID=UPI0036A6F866